MKVVVLLMLMEVDVMEAVVMVGVMMMKVVLGRVKARGFRGPHGGRVDMVVQLGNECGVAAGQLLRIVARQLPRVSHQSAGSRETAGDVLSLSLSLPLHPSIPLYFSLSTCSRSHALLFVPSLSLSPLLLEESSLLRLSSRPSL